MFYFSWRSDCFVDVRCCSPPCFELFGFSELLVLLLFKITNLSYEKVVVDTPVNETVIYLDPPYAGTAKYKDVICHNELNKYIADSPYKIYVSGYDMDLPIVAEFSHRSTLSATANNKVVEKLFCNK